MRGPASILGTVLLLIVAWVGPQRARPASMGSCSCSDRGRVTAGASRTRGTATAAPFRRMAFAAAGVLIPIVNGIVLDVVLDTDRIRRTEG